MFNSQQYEDTMEHYLNTAIEIWMNDKTFPNQRKKAGQRILDLCEYLETNYPEEFGTITRPRRLIQFLTDKERNLIAKIAIIDKERAKEELRKLAGPRIYDAKYVFDEEIDSMIPYASNFLKENRNIGRQKTRF